MGWNQKRRRERERENLRSGIRYLADFPEFLVSVRTYVPTYVFPSLPLAALPVARALALMPYGKSIFRRQAEAGSPSPGPPLPAAATDTDDAAATATGLLGGLATFFFGATDRVSRARISPREPLPLEQLGGPGERGRGGGQCTGVRTYSLDARLASRIYFARMYIHTCTCIFARRFN